MTQKTFKPTIPKSIELIQEIQNETTATDIFLKTTRFKSYAYLHKILKTYQKLGLIQKTKQKGRLKVMIKLTEQGQKAQESLKKLKQLMKIK